MSNSDSIKCHDDCFYQVLIIQARTRLNLANVIVSSMHSLLASERFLKNFQMPGWAALDETIVRKQIELSEKAIKKSSNDLKVCSEMVEQGCSFCRAKENALYQAIEQCVAEDQPTYDYDYALDFTLQSL